MSGTSAKGRAYLYHTCTRCYTERREACEGVRVPQFRLERFVIAQVRGRILEKATPQSLVEMVNEELKDRGDEMQVRLDIRSAEKHSVTGRG